LARLRSGWSCRIAARRKARYRRSPSASHSCPNRSASIPSESVQTTLYRLQFDIQLVAVISVLGDESFLEPVDGLFSEVAKVRLRTTDFSRAIGFLARPTDIVPLVLATARLAVAVVEQGLEMVSDFTTVVVNERPEGS